MTTYIPHTIGRVYDVAHLKPFDLELAKQGHPLAWTDAREVRLLREMSGNNFSYDYWDDDGWVSCDLFDLKGLNKNLRLAPLAIKHDPRTGKDEPLHVGDVIQYEHDEYSQSGDFVNVKVELTNSKPIDYWDDFLKFGNWRWPAEVQG